MMKMPHPASMAKTEAIIEKKSDLMPMEEAEKKVDEVLRAVIADNKELVELLGARAIQGKAYLPGSEDDIESKED